MGMDDIHFSWYDKFSLLYNGRFLFIMAILVIMCIGMVAGSRLIPRSNKVLNERFQLICTLTLIFSMGVNLGSRDDFLSDLLSLGFQSFLFCMIPTVFSVWMVYYLAKWFLNRREAAESISVQTAGASSSFSGHSENAETAGEGGGDYMVFYALCALILGIFAGMAKPDGRFLTALTSNTGLLLSLLMFSVGISIGFQKGVFSKIRQYHVKILVIPLGIVIASLIGGIVCGLLMGYPLHESASVASGLGWYSLAGVAIGNLAGAKLGSIAFLSNLMREIISFFLIPYLARRFGKYACIAPAGATSEDTTLPMLIKYTDEETVVLSVINGIVCSAFVPVLISMCYSF